MFFHGVFAILFQGIVFALAAGLALAPASLDKAALLHAVKHRVKHAIRPLQLAAGAGLDFLDNGVTVALAPGEEGQNEGFSRSSDKFFADHRGTIHRDYRYVKS